MDGDVEVKAAADLEAFFARLAKCASAFKWKLVPGPGGRRLVRTEIEGVRACPLLAIGYAQSKDKAVPDAQNMVSAAGVGDRAAACVVHHADEITTSRYYRKAVRARLLRACGLPPGDSTPPEVSACSPSPSSS